MAMRLNRTVRLCLRFAVCLSALALMLTTATEASAQVGGSVSGTVKDQTGGVMPGVSVTATNSVNGAKYDTTTSAQGAFSFPKLPVGRYDLLFNLDGFKPLIRFARFEPATYLASIPVGTFFHS
jgi:Carboxypeptidase regulatory-like domain